MVAASAPETTDAYAIWLHVRSAVTAARYPSRLDYTIDVSGVDGQRPSDDHYRASYDSGGAIKLFPLSDEQLEKPPPVPRGVNVRVKVFFCWIGCWGIQRQVGRPEPSLDLLGEPLLTPTYTFGIRYAAQQGAVTAADGSSLPTIAVVSAQKPEYRVKLVDTPTLDGVQTYHLNMIPLRIPSDNRLRELWVGVDDYLPRRASISGNFTTAPMVDVPWTVDFAVSGGAPYIARESAAGTLYLPHGRVVSRAEIAFQGVQQSGNAIYHRPIVSPEITETTLVEP